MNFESNRKIVVARTEEDMYEKLEQLKAQGYSENDIHVVAKDRSHMDVLDHQSNVSTHAAGSVMDKFKSWFTGEDSITEGLRKLNLSEAETERYSKDVASGGFVLFTEGVAEANNGVMGTHQNEFEEGYDTFGSTGNSYESYHGEERPLQINENDFEETNRNEMTSNFEETNSTIGNTSSVGTNFVESRFNENETNVLGNENYIGQSENRSTTRGANSSQSESTFENQSNQSQNEPTFKNQFNEPQSEYAKEQGFEQSTNEFVNETDGRFDEPQDRYARGESFATDPYMAREQDHIGHSMQEDSMVQEHRPTIDETITNKRQSDDFQSPGADPNLGPAAFGNDATNEFPSGELTSDFENDSRAQKNQNFNSEYRSETHHDTFNQLNESSSTNSFASDSEVNATEGHGNPFAFDTNSTNSEWSSGEVNNDEIITTNEYEERIDKDKHRKDVPPHNEFF